MLPFTKRPARADDNDVITKDDLVRSSDGDKGAAPVRSLLPSITEEELTTLMPRSPSSRPSPLRLPAPLPAAGRAATPSRARPVTVRPPPPSMRPPPPSHRANANATAKDDEDEGRTVVRGAPKIVKRAKSLGAQASQGSLAPAAAFKASFESTRGGDRQTASHEERGSTLWSRGEPAPVFERHMPTFEGPPSHRPPPAPVPQTVKYPSHAPQSYPPPAAASYPPPPTASYPPPPPASYSAPPNSYASPPSSRPHAYSGPVSNGSASIPGVVMPALPAHFMHQQHSDPPGTSITSSHQRVNGRPALSWAVALLACGLFVGVSAVAMMQNNNESVADTTASFVDPSRAAKAPAAAQAPAPVVATPVVVPAQPAAPAANAVNPAPGAPAPAVAAPVAVAPVAAPVVVAPSAAPQPAPVAVPAPAVVLRGNVGVAPVAAAPRPAPPRQVWRPAPPPPKAASKVAAADDEPKESKKFTRKGGGPDDETKKALEALQKAQLESSSSFGDKP